MQITLDQKDQTFASLKVSFEESDYQDRVDAKIKEHSKKANIKGFRPGKVPPSLIKRMMGGSIVADEVLQLLSESINNYIKEQNLNIIGEPLPNKEETPAEIDWNNQKDFEFIYDLGIIPEFKYDLGDKLKATKYVVEVEEATLEETTEGLLERSAKSVDAEEVEKGDFVSGKLTSEDGSFDTETIIPTNKLAATELKKFVGKKIDAEVSLDLQKAFKKDAKQISHVTGLSPEEAEKVEGKYNFKITQISRSEKGVKDKSFFDQVLGPDVASTEEEFNAKLKEILERNYNQDSDIQLFIELKNTLTEKTEIPISRDFLKRWILETSKEEVNVEELDSNIEDYEKELKWNILKNKIAGDLEVKVEDEEVRNRARINLQQQLLGGAPIQPELEETFANFVENHLKENNGKNYVDIYEQVLTDKLFETMKGKVTLKEKKIKSEAFKKMVEEKS